MIALRAGVLVVGVVLGALIIANTGPPGGAHPRGIPGPRGIVPIPHPHASSSSQPLVCGKPTGVRVAVENATTLHGLAAATATKLQNVGYSVDPKTDIGNAPSQSSTTTVYFQGAGNQHAALCLKKNFFHNATVKALPPGSGLSALVQAAVYLGSDYAA